MSKFKNYGLWVSIASLVLIVLQNANVAVIPEQYNTIVNAVLTILVTLGILSNPSQGTGYIDK